MKDNFLNVLDEFWQTNIVGYINIVRDNPLRLVVFIIDIAIVVFLIYKLVKATNTTRVWQLIKGITFFVIITVVSGWLQLNILHFILTSIMTYGVIALIVIFQPELRRGLEQLGTNKITKFFGINQEIATKTKEDIYKIAIAAEELASTKTGGLIVIEREIKIGDIAENGIAINADVSPQLLVNIFVPNTPLHDGAVIISNNKIVSAACILPLSNDKQISKSLGTRHRAALGISKETDSIVVVVSEETGKISIAKNGTLIMDVDIENLKKILVKELVTNVYKNGSRMKPGTITKLRNKFEKKNNNKEDSKKDKVDK